MKRLEAVRLKGKHSALIDHPTASGKTMTAAVDAMGFGACTLYLVHTKTIRRQALESFSDVWPEARPYIVTKKDLKNLEKLTRTHKVVLMSCQFALQNLEMIPSGLFKYVIIDEAHRVATRTYQAILGRLKPRFLLGLTGTSLRFDKIDVSIFFDEVAHRVSMKELVDQGVLPSVRSVRVHTNIASEYLSTVGEDFNMFALDRLINVPQRNELIVETFLEHTRAIKPDASCVTFCVTVRHAEALAEMFRAAGISAACVHGRMEDEELNDILAAYEEGRIQVLTSCLLLSEGWDSPRTDVLLMARPTLSHVLYLQQFGRGLRTHPRKACLWVYDFVDNLARMQSPCSLHRVFEIPVYKQGEDVFELQVLFLSLPDLAVDGVEYVDLFDPSSLVTLPEMARRLEVTPQELRRALDTGELEGIPCEMVIREKAKKRSSTYYFNESDEDRIQKAMDARRDRVIAAGERYHRSRKIQEVRDSVSECSVSSEPHVWYVLHTPLATIQMLSKSRSRGLHYRDEEVIRAVISAVGYEPSIDERCFDIFEKLGGPVLFRLLRESYRDPLKSADQKRYCAAILALKHEAVEGQRQALMEGLRSENYFIVYACSIALVAIMRGTETRRIMNVLRAEIKDIFHRATDEELAWWWSLSLRVQCLCMAVMQGGKSVLVLFDFLPGFERLRTILSARYETSWGDLVGGFEFSLGYQAGEVTKADERFTGCGHFFDRILQRALELQPLDPHRAKDPFNPPTEEQTQGDLAKAQEVTEKSDYLIYAVNEAIRRVGTYDALVTAALEKIRDTIVIRAGPFTYIWGSFYNGELFLHHLLLDDPEYYSECIVTLIHEARVMAYPGSSDAQNEAFARRCMRSSSRFAVMKIMARLSLWGILILAQPWTVFVCAAVYLLLVVFVMPRLIRRLEAWSKERSFLGSESGIGFDLQPEDCIRRQLQEHPFFRIGRYDGFKKKVYANLSLAFVAKIPKKPWEELMEHFFFRPKIFFWEFPLLLRLLRLLRSGSFEMIRLKARRFMHSQRPLVPEPAMIPLVDEKMGALMATTRSLRDVAIRISVMRWERTIQVHEIEVQERCVELRDVFCSVISMGMLDDAYRLVDALIAVIEGGWQAGAFIGDPKLSNFGKSLEDGEVKLLDCGDVLFSYNDSVVLPNDFLRDFSFLNRHSPLVASYYARRMADTFTTENLKKHWLAPALVSFDGDVQEQAIIGEETISDALSARQGSDYRFEREVRYSHRNDRAFESRQAKREELLRGFPYSWAHPLESLPEQEGLGRAMRLLSRRLTRRLGRMIMMQGMIDGRTREEYVLSQPLSFIVEELLKDAFDSCVVSGVDEAQVVLRSYVEADDCCIEIGDNGVGIRIVPDKQPEIFIEPLKKPGWWQRFFMLEGGNNVGLLWSYVLIAGRGGKLEFIPVTEEGAEYKTIVRIRLPLSAVRSDSFLNPYGPEEYVNRGIDTVNEKYNGDLLRKIEEHLSWGLDEPARVLFLGCGRGFEVFELMHRFGDDVCVTATSLEDLRYQDPGDLVARFAQEGIEISYDDAVRYIVRLTGEHFRLCDLNDGIPFDGPFDFVIFGSCVMAYVSEKAFALRESLRVCAEGGFVFADVTGMYVVEGDTQSAAGAYFNTLNDPYARTFFRINPESFQMEGDWVRMQQVPGFYFPLFTLREVSVNQLGRVNAMYEVYGEERDGP